QRAPERHRVAPERAVLPSASSASGRTVVGTGSGVFLALGLAGVGRDGGASVDEGELVSHDARGVGCVLGRRLRGGVTRGCSFWGEGRGGVARAPEPPRRQPEGSDAKDHGT